LYIDGEGGKKIGIWVDGKRMEWVVGKKLLIFLFMFFLDFLKKIFDEKY